jgi:hypothetical protein
MNGKKVCPQAERNAMEQISRAEGRWFDPLLLKE